MFSDGGVIACVVLNTVLCCFRSSTSNALKECHLDDALWAYTAQHNLREVVLPSRSVRLVRPLAPPDRKVDVN